MRHCQLVNVGLDWDKAERIILCDLFITALGSVGLAVVRAEFQLVLLLCALTESQESSVTVNKLP